MYPNLCYKDVSKKHLKALDIDTNSWETLDVDSTGQISALKQQIIVGEENWMDAEYK